MVPPKLVSHLHHDIASLKLVSHLHHDIASLMS